MWQKLIQLTRDYFYISHKEARGSLVLLFLITITILGTFLYRQTEGNTPIIELLSQEQIDSLFVVKKSYKSRVIEYRAFDPNTETDFESLGIPPFLSKRINKYRLAGGKFKKAEDLKKIYGFPDSLYLQLEPFIQIHQKNEKEEIKHSRIVTSNSNQKIDYSRINQTAFNFNLALVDSVELTNFPGIGPTYASRIVRYRERLGGFVSANQLHEVYGLPHETAEKLIQSGTVDTSLVQQLDLNQVTFKQLLKHPYLEYEDVQNIFNFKRKYGGFNQVQDLQKYHVLPDSVYTKIYPYLKI